MSNRHARRLAKIVEQIPEEMQLQAAHTVKPAQIPVTVTGDVGEPSFTGFVKFLADDPGAIAGRTVDFYAEKGQQAAQGASDMVSSMSQKITQAKDAAVESMANKAKNYLLGDVFGFEAETFERIPDFFGEIQNVLQDPEKSFLDKAMSIIGCIIHFIESLFTTSLSQADRMEQQQANLKKLKETARTVTVPQKSGTMLQ